MPTSVLSRARLFGLLGPDVPAERLEAALFASKAEVVHGHADGTLLGPGDELEVTATPDRLDLLCEGGLALHLEGALGLAAGAARVRRARPTGDPLRIEVDPSVVPLRPHIAGVVVRAPTGKPLDASLLAEAVRFQELLHATVGRDRRAASLGIYPARRLASPVRYALEPLAGVEFTPLDADRPVPVERFYDEHPMAKRYGPLGRSGDRCLTLRDAAGRTLSLPPVLNDRYRGEAAEGDRVLLLESTGTRSRAVLEGLGLLLVVFASRGWSVRPVPVLGPGDARSDGESLLAPAARVLPAAVLEAVDGARATPAAVADRLRSARLGARRVRGGWRVAVPPWRPDLLSAVDVAEDVILAGGLRAQDGILPPSAGRGRRLPTTVFRSRVAELLLGLGFVAPLTTVLVSDAAAGRLEGITPIRLANPVSREYSVVRDRLLISHLEVLARNTRHGYPQRFAEVAPVVVPAPSAEAGGETRSHASLVLAQDGAGFADAAATVDYLLRALDVGSVREPAELPGTIPGRAARVRVAGEPVAEIGELHPRLLVELGVPVPAAWAELDLTALGPLAGLDETTK